MLREILASMFHPSEVNAMVSMKLGGHFSGAKAYKGALKDLPKGISDSDFCYAVLNKVSRSFALVIQQLPEVLKDCICIFYLVLRGLDSVEDDQDVPVDVKVPLLREFHEKLEVDGYCLDNVGDTPDYKYLMSQFGKVVSCYKALAPEYRAVIADITKRMGNGMADFVEKKVDTVEDYNLYCHYVAGLVGIGLVKLMAHSGLEDPDLGNQEKLANSMGLFLQKTNIIRDYLEDLQVGRVWWPKELYQAHGFATIEDIKEEPKSQRSLDVLNHLVNDALSLIPDCLDFMSRLRNVECFKFCAIPQVMAIATLDQLYNNAGVYTGVVKIRKGTSCLLILETDSYLKFQRIFRDYAASIASKVRDGDYAAQDTRARLTHVEEQTRGASSVRVQTNSGGVAGYVPIATLLLGAAAVSYAVYANRARLLK